MTSDREETFSPINSSNATHELYYHLKQNPRHVKSSSSSNTDDQHVGLLLPFTAQNTVKVYRLSLVVTASVFMGYAALVTMQHKLKEQIQDNYDAAGRVWTDEVETVFDHGVACNYIGNLIFRGFHNIFFGCVSPRKRVYMALIFMATAMTLIILVFFLGESTQIPFVYLIYLLGGIGVGTFESNLLTCITPLGPNSKIWAILGMPFGFNFVSIVGYFLMSWGLTPPFIYCFVAVCCVLSIWIFRTAIPKTKLADLHSWEDFKRDLRYWKVWVKKVLPFALALLLAQFCMAFSTAINYYILDDEDYVPLTGPQSSELFDHDMFFALISFCTFFGDTISRYVVYKLPPGGSHFRILGWLGLGFFGILLILLPRVPWMVLPAMFMIFWTNGAVYAESNRFIDRVVDHEYNLSSLSLWLFIGDLGSVTGANTWELARSYVCRGVVSKHMCKASN